VVEIPDGFSYVSAVGAHWSTHETADQAAHGTAQQTA
jgi:hypothetical protein